METLEHLKRQEFLKEITPLLLIPLGVVMVYVGLTLGMRCTSYLPITLYCNGHAFAVPGYGTAFVGGCVALIGLGWFLGRGSREPPLLEPRMRIQDPVLSARVERGSRLAFVGLIGLGLAIAEAFPVYSLALQTMQGTGATFDVAWFAADVILFALADLMVLFVVWEWTGTQ